MIGTAVEHLGVNVRLRPPGKALEKVGHQFRLQVTDEAGPGFGINYRGSASAEIHALRRVFGEVADQIVIANTKGLTGHAMAAGIEDVVAVKALETGILPPTANFTEADPACNLDYVPNESRPGPVRAAMMDGFGRLMGAIAWPPDFSISTATASAPACCSGVGWLLISC